MKRLIFASVFLIAICGIITVAYFRNLNPPGEHTSQIMRNIPADASLVMEFGNENGFYEIFRDNKLMAAAAGKRNIDELDTLRKLVIAKGPLAPYFEAQHLFVSVHPTDTSANLLITTATNKDIAKEYFDGLPKKDVEVKTITLSGKKGYAITIKPLHKIFYIINKGRHVLSGTFSRKLAEQCAAYQPAEHGYKLLSVQQNNNALANLYISHKALPALLQGYFSNRNNMPADLYGFDANAVLTLNYKSDALMFNGSTTIGNNAPPSYINLFAHQKAHVNRLKNILPSTTAWYTSFALSDSKTFLADLLSLQKQTGTANKRQQLINTIKQETGVDVQDIFAKWLGNEFAVVTTRFQEKLGIIEIKNGTLATAPIMNISSQMSDNTGRFNYNDIPANLLGDAFKVFRKPYFMIIDNYLVLANSFQEIQSYQESYLNRKFLVKASDYNAFNNLISERSNVSFFVAIKNCQQVFKRDLTESAYNSFENNEPGWQNVYGVSYQLTAAENGFYTNFCIALNADSEESAADSIKKTE